MELGWIDYSEQDRQRTMDVLAALHEPTAVDELGIGIIRDAFANAFFPATSTLLTRAKYFFLVPYALRDLERRDNRRFSADALRKSYDDTEKELAIELLKGARNTQGITGARSLRSDFSGSWVKRGPGVVYWSPLRQLGILKHPSMGYTDYFRAIANSDGRAEERASQDDMDNGWNDDDSVRTSFWRVPGVTYKQWRNNLSIELTQGEAEFLASRIMLSFPDSMFAFILNDPTLRSGALELFRSSSKAQDDAVDTEIVGASLFHDFASAFQGSFPEQLSVLSRHAVVFSDFVYGCRIRYNALLTGHEEEAEAEWESYSPQASEFAASLDLDAIYKLLHLEDHSGAGPLLGFMRTAKEAMRVGDVPKLDDCIIKREHSIKHDRAKIGRLEGVPETWRSGRRLSYRFGTAMSIVSEIEAAGGCNA